MEIKTANINDFDIAFKFIENLWDYNKYNKEEVKKIYNEVINNDNSFAFFVIDNDEYKGFCHGDYFNTFWMSGKTCYVSSLITKENERGKGYGTFLLDYAKKLAKEKLLFLTLAYLEQMPINFMKNMGLKKVVMDLN